MHTMQACIFMKKEGHDGLSPPDGTLPMGTTYPCKIKTFSPTLVLQKIFWALNNRPIKSIKR